ncbi:DEAD/DEAH box helicase [Shewanella sp. 202IG2-18]|uniref:DEAD/DEAH box helicase n=1 Tax=Parashewanella hymeniacidonis TaxID=2807618 RepID=UPI00195F56A0|nr:DEAD/DEAH box helicase [Parashewanella hymeniacidonis]MBM7070712.1 DEAD/DEAH box helicase [Parashewanella hymeniacidonis]
MKLRDYQQDSVDAALVHFRQSIESAVIVLPTGAGKSIVIAELARIAKGRVLILTHVKELVEQNAEKVGLLTEDAAIYSAGLKQKQSSAKTVVASVQSAARAPQKFSEPFSLVIIDECHRVSLNEKSQYQMLLTHLRETNPNIRLLGLTATPYRLGIGWIYRNHYHGKVGNTENPTFEKCIFELPLRPLIKQKYLTPPKVLDGVSAQYDFSIISPNENGEYSEAKVNAILSSSGRATKQITQQIFELSKSREGVIIFAATVRHAQEVLSYLNEDQAVLITADTSTEERDTYIRQFKTKQFKFLVNVSVLTTGFDAPHVDFIAILRPTASVSLFQQMVGRGLRLADNKDDCLVIDYAANGYDLYFPEVGQAKPNSKSVPVQVHCPVCKFANTFWGITDNDGDLVEHFGRRCQGLVEINDTEIQCEFRFRSKSCPDCGSENDIAARICQTCNSTLIDPDKRLKQVLANQHHHLFKVQDMLLHAEGSTLKVQYIDIEANDYIRKFKMETKGQIKAFYALFVFPHTKTPGILHTQYQKPEQVVEDSSKFRKPDLILLKKNKKFWQWMESYFDYSGRYQVEKDM